MTVFVSSDWLYDLCRVAIQEIDTHRNSKDREHIERTRESLKKSFWMKYIIRKTEFTDNEVIKYLDDRCGIFETWRDYSDHTIYPVLKDLIKQSRLAPAVLLDSTESHVVYRVARRQFHNNPDNIRLPDDLIREFREE